MQVDEHGNNADRKFLQNQHIEDKEFGRIPFPAIVVAYYAKAQKVDVVYPQMGGLGFISDVDVYGSHGDLLGVLETPDIAVEKTDTGYNLDPDLDDNNVETNDHKNNIECLVKKTTDGYATSEFRALHETSPLWMNAQKGRRMQSFSDGSYSVQDKDGNHEFVHCSGLRIKIGDSEATIAMDDDMPVNTGNVSAMTSNTTLTIFHPEVDAKLGFDKTGKIIIETATGKLGAKIGAFIDEVNKIIVAQGTGPDVGALAQLKIDILEILG